MPRLGPSGSACGVITSSGAGARALLPPRRPARPGRLGDPCPGHACGRRRGAGRGLVQRPAPVTLLVSLAAVALVLDAVDGWVARRTRTTATLGRAVRRRGRRVPDPRPQRLCRALGRRVGARDRRGTLRVPRRRVAAAMDARAAAAALLAQGRRCDAGDRAGGRGRGRPAAGRQRAALVAPSFCLPSRSAATCGGCGATATARICRGGGYGSRPGPADATRTGPGPADAAPTGPEPARATRIAVVAHDPRRSDRVGGPGRPQPAADVT